VQTSVAQNIPLHTNSYSEIRRPRCVIFSSQPFTNFL